MGQPASKLVGTSPAWRHAVDRIVRFAPYRRPVAIEGEVGSGKTTLAQLLHQASGRRGRFVLLSAGEIEHNLLRAALYGHDRGVFTGAHRARLGAFRRAADGTFVIDEAHLMLPEDQGALLRVMSSGMFLRWGDERDSVATLRVVLCYGEPLELLAGQGRLIPDLRRRIGYFIVRVPPLRERPEDIPALAQHLAALFVQQENLPSPPPFDPETLRLLQRLPWRQNTGQLQAAVEAATEAALHFNAPAIAPWHFPAEVLKAEAPARRRGKYTPEEYAAAVVRHRGNLAAAARELGVSRTTIYRHLPGRRGG